MVGSRCQGLEDGIHKKILLKHMPFGRNAGGFFAGKIIIG